MNHPHEKYVRLEIIFILIALITGIVALFKGMLILIFISLYFITFSFLCEALLEWISHRATTAGKQFIRAIILFFLATYLLFTFYF